jgi:phosphoribosylformylglycinamidine synthase
MQFVCKNIFITNEHDPKKEVFKLPVAHGEGRYYADEKTLENLEKQEQILYRYCDETGNISNAHNPNGATLNIAGIYNAERNIIGMMPHPERACSKILNNEDGKKVLSSLFSIN